MAPVRLGSKTVGSIVKVAVNGHNRNFIIVQQGRPTTMYDASWDSATILLQQEVIETKDMLSSQGTYGNLNYSRTYMHSHLNSTFYNAIESKCKSLLMNIKIPYCWSNESNFQHQSMAVYSGANGLDAKVFLPSAWELGFSGNISDHKTIPDGNTFSCFSDGNTSKLISPNWTIPNRCWWTRTMAYYTGTGSTERFEAVVVENDLARFSPYYGKHSNVNGIRPALSMSKNAWVLDDGTITSNTAPTIPSSINVPAIVKGGENTIISWGTSTDLDGNLAGYELERSVNGAAFAQVFKGNALTTSQAITKGWINVAFRVRAYDSFGEYSAYQTSATRTVINNTAPTTPASITVPATVKGGESITVSWASSTDPDGNLAGYRLERSVNGAAYAQVYQGTAASSSQAITKGWNTVAFRVKAYDSPGLESGYQTSPARTIINNSAPPIPPSINVPTIIKGGSNITVSWGASVDPDGNLAGYRLERSVNGGAYEQVYQGAALSSSQAIAKGWNNVAFRVKAYDTPGLESGYRTSAVIIINRAPSVPGAITCDPVPKIGRQVTLKCGESIDPDGNTIEYIWERSVDGAAYALIGKSSAPTIMDTIPVDGFTYQVRVKAVDNPGDESEYSTSNEMEILYNEPPTTPGTITYGDIPREGSNLIITCGISIDPDGDTIRYIWERKTDTGEYQLIGITEHPSITDTIPQACSFYQVRVKATDSAGKSSEYAIGEVVAVLQNTPPEISGEDVNLEQQKDVVKYTYTITDPDENETLTVTEKVVWGEKERILRTFQATTGETYTADTSPVWLELTGGAQLVIEVCDFLNAGAVRVVSFTRTVDRIAASRSFETGQTVEKCIIAFDPRVLPEGCQLTLEACNNPFAPTPVWEDMSDKANKAIHTFTNTNVATPGLAYRFIVTKGDETAKIQRVIVKYA